MNRKVSLVFLVILIWAWPLVCQAEVTRFFFTVFTTNFPDTSQRRLDVAITLGDTRYRQPDAITYLKVTAPDTAKTVMDLTQNCWDELRLQFFTSFLPSFFSEGTIPSGSYVAKVKDKSGQTLTVRKTLDASFLPCPGVTYPAAGAVLTELKPTITWTQVAGAQLYSIYLDNRIQGEVIYNPPMRSLDVYTNSFTLQTGVLKPDTPYRLRIEARDSDKMMNRRSRSDWVYFSTSPNAQ